MSEMVKAAVLVEPGRIEMQEFPMPKPEKGGAVGKMILSGICGTDKHSFQGETLQNAGTAAETEIALPLIQGHENLFVITDIDEEGSKNLEWEGEILKPGDRVTMCPDVVCGKCWYCKHFPTYPWCDDTKFCYGNTRSCKQAPHLFGGFAESIYIVPGTRLYKVPDEMPDEMAVLAEIMCVAYSLDKAKEFNSFAMEGFNFDDTFVIQGCGPLGLAHLIKARMMGAGKIIVTDVSDYKLNLAKEFGADIVINSSRTTEEERVELVREQTCGRGADVVIECVGRPFVVTEGLRMLRRAGMYIEVGNYVDCGSLEINWNIICTKNLRIVGMCNHAHTGYRATMDMMLRTRDQFPWEKFVSHKYPLEQAQQALLKSMAPDSMKVTIAPGL